MSGASCGTTAGLRSTERFSVKRIEFPADLIDREFLVIPDRQVSVRRLAGDASPIPFSDHTRRASDFLAILTHGDFLIVDFGDGIDRHQEFSIADTQHAARRYLYETHLLLTLIDEKVIDFADLFSVLFRIDVAISNPRPTTSSSGFGRGAAQLVAKWLLPILSSSMEQACGAECGIRISRNGSKGAPSAASSAKWEDRGNFRIYEEA
jgi:hypothetical protein